MTDQEESNRERPDESARLKGLEEERYRLLVETTNDLIWELDQTGVYTYASPRFKELLGYEPEELIGKTPFEFMPVQERERLRAMFDEYRASGQGSLQLEVVRLHRDGRQLVHETNVSPVFDTEGTFRGFRGISRDITERRQAEKALQQSHEELRAIYDGMVDGLLIADIEAKQFVRANHAISRMLGYSEDEILSLSVMDIHPPEDLPDILEKFQALAEGQMAVAENLPVLRKDGSVFYADITSNRLEYQGRSCNIGFFRDITERKRAEERLHEEHRVLGRLLRAQDRERQMIAYEIHDGLAQQLTAAIMHFQAFDRMTQPIPAEASKILGTVHELLDQSLAEARRLISGMRPPILDEHGVLAAIEHLVHANTCQANVRVSFHSEVGFDRIEPVLENAIYRIVQESLSNACRHSGSDKVRIELTQDGERVRVMVQDWGNGFDPQGVDDKCFGLAGIRERARLLGGEVSIDSGLGEGTRVVVGLPLTAGAADI